MLFGRTDPAAGRPAAGRAFRQFHFKGAHHRPPASQESHRSQRRRRAHLLCGRWNLAQHRQAAHGLRDYPLHMMQAYEIERRGARVSRPSVAAMKQSKIDGIKAISRNRRTLLPYGAVALQEVLTAMGAARVSFSALGVREGYLYSLLGGPRPGAIRCSPPQGELAILRARSPEHARELAAWTGKMFPVFGVTESEEDPATARRPAFSPISPGVPIPITGACRRSTSSPTAHSPVSATPAAPISRSPATTASRVSMMMASRRGWRR
jgi:hypothetical protein